MRKPELLVPASSLEVLKVAVIFGADAVYIGGEVFGLRAKAKNFSMEDMKEGVEFAHAHGVKVHVTVNILAHNDDLPGVEEYLKELKEVGPDALIIADPGVTLFQQMPGGQISAGLVIVPQHRQAQLRIAAVNEDNGHSGGPELLVQIQIGIGQSGFGALNDETLHRMLQQLGQDLPFFFKLIVRAVDQGGKAVFQQSLLTFHQQGREDIGIGNV